MDNAINAANIAVARMFSHLQQAAAAARGCEGTENFPSLFSVIGAPHCRHKFPITVLAA